MIFDPFTLIFHTQTFPQEQLLRSLTDTASHIFMANLVWAKNVLAFRRLAPEDQLRILKDSWRQLFVIGLAELQFPLESMWIIYKVLKYGTVGNHLNFNGPF